MIAANNLNVSYGDKIIIEALNLTLPKGKITALIGPNGCGKSTLLKTLARINMPTKGEVLLNGKALKSYRDKHLAQEMSLLPQVLETPEGITVKRLVEYGRSPYLSHWGKLGEHDNNMVASAMRETGVDDLAEQTVESLSGGQRQRAWIAMILAQDTNIVMLDEPTTYLDLSHQIELMKIMREMNNKGKTVIVVLHDLNQACRYCDHLVVLKKGQLIAQGSPDDVFTETLLKDVFSLDARVIQDPVANTPMCIAH
ncbi:ferric citrate ABC transporter ATP-binding protein FecE [Vibrio natriegens]|uniref:Fe(3+) dicitrate ABC transporter ATP-binding protein FecE n=1 Tax=Vibrio TaxID=662 RepID=UPI0008046E48|nr:MULTISPECIES: Fe(3+) dicitrate ABC transporter ATP-binding protein FecE [Vibrio]ANQ17600.1 ferric citrate ABC transporter ATP-binding protein FecE [Vibrio natriegens]ANQ22180.1 ferric citrate ABC transporter ATP-binding protein FecE [Vibrio natriegens]ANQ26898.1 ferric citrate ABC transporter ATP-binding protein FecE [Vibrio natriegens]AXT71347.1 iron-dicitrate ABC transporter ATP-binding subunit [Vibrio sp. dhg]